MNAAILISVGLASAAGLLVGFRKYWIEVCLVACLAIPAALSTVFALRLGAPSLFDTAGWALITFFYAFICASIAWGICAGVNYGSRKVYCKLTRRSSEDRPQAAGPLS